MDVVENQFENLYPLQNKCYHLNVAFNVGRALQPKVDFHLR